MKKFLLFSAAALMSMSASAGLTDVTPKAYIFDNALQVPTLNAYADASWGNLAWNPAAYFLDSHPETYKDGLILCIGPQFQAAYDDIMKGWEVVNFGGTLGNVLVINRAGSGLVDALREATGITYEIPEMAADAGFMVPLWHEDPSLKAEEEEGGIENNMRVRIIFNLYQQGNSETSAMFQPYMQYGGVWQPNEDNNAADKFAYPGDFAKLWGEVDAADGRVDFATASKDDLEKYVNDDEVLEWNPERWMVYELDFPHLDGKETAKIKMELPGVPGAIMIKSVQFLLKDADEEGIAPATRRKTWTYYTYGAQGDAVETVAADAVEALDVTVNGNNVAFGEAATVYTATGAVVAKGQEVNLANGFYVAVANGKTAKFVVK